MVFYLLKKIIFLLTKQFQAVNIFTDIIDHFASFHFPFRTDKSGGGGAIYHTKLFIFKQHFSLLEGKLAATASLYLYKSEDNSLFFKTMGDN